MCRLKTEVPGSRPHPARLTLAFAAALVGVLALHYANVGPEWPPFAEHLYEGVELLAAACCLWRAKAYRRERTPWLVIGLGMISFAAAELYYTIFLEHRAVIPYPSLADALYLGLYPCCSRVCCCWCAAAPGGCRGCSGSTG